MDIVKKIVDRANAPDNTRPKIVLSLQPAPKKCVNKSFKVMDIGVMDNYVLRV